MEVNWFIIMITLIIVIFIGIGVITVLVLVGDEEVDEDFQWNCGGSNLDMGSKKLNISDEGYAFLQIGPFMDGYDGIPGINVTIHLKDKNITAYTRTDGYAIFHITYPIEYDEYNVTAKYQGEITTYILNLEVTED